MNYLLSSFSDCANLSIVNDGMFSELGMVEHNFKNMLSIYYDKNFLKRLKNNKNICAVLTTRELAQDLDDLYVAVSPNPIESFYKIHNYLFYNTSHFGKKYKSIIDSGCKISKNAYISTNNVKIGRNCVIENFVTIHENTTIGDDVIIASGTQVGCNGFEVKSIDGKRMIIPHAGGVVIGNNVEILSNCTIARGLGKKSTLIGNSTKFDTKVHVAHEVEIGEFVTIASGATIAGSVSIHDNVWVGPNACISNGVVIGKNSRVTIGSTVVKNVEENGHVTGHFSINHKDYLKHWVKIQRFDKNK